MSITEKHLTIVTTTRADYGLLRPVIERIKKRNELNYTIVATGSHISDKTISEIEGDGYDYKTIDIIKYPQNKEGVARITALTQQLFIDYFVKNPTDGLLILGDRYEVFAIAVAARFLDIPIFHVSGGDVTSGAIDDCLRHCITKLSSVHFPSCKKYAKRLMALGEQPESIYMVGGLGDENIRNMSMMSAPALSSSLGFNLERNFLLVTYHPETLSELTETQQVEELVDALENYDGAVVVTGANSDSGGEQINLMLKEFCDKSADRFYIKSMGALRYLSAMKAASAVVGNSSSGVCETPTLGVPTVNIGNRQNGRIMAENIFCCSCDRTQINKAIKLCLSQMFTAKARKAVSPYYGENTADRIATITARLINKGVERYKEFYDV